MIHQEKPALDEDLLEHHGIRGMKWGVRRENRISRLERVGSGKGSTGDNLRVGLTEVSGLSRMRNGGVRGAAANKAANMRTRDARVASGHATVMDHLARHGGDRIFDSGGKLKITPPVGKTVAPTAKTATATRKPGFAHEVKVSADRISVHPRMTEVTKNVVRDHNNLSNKDFFRKYQVSKAIYRSRVQKHGDPYMHRKALATRLNNSVFGRRARSSVAKKQAKEARAR